MDASVRCRAVWASRDREGLRESIWQHLTGTIAGRSPAGAGRPGRYTKNRRAPYAFDLWIAHLALLEQILEIAPIPWKELRAEEMEGLLLLRTARERFRSEYHPCAQCGVLIKGKICTRCGTVN